MAQQVEIGVTGDLTPILPQKEDPFANALKMFQLPPNVAFGAPVVHEWVQHRRENIRPWLTFFNTSYLRKPPSATRLTKRVLANIEYFKSNYLFVYLGLVLYCLITSPLLLIAVAASAGVLYLLFLRHKEGMKVNILGKDLPLGQQYALVAICSLPIFYIAGAGAALFWVFGASFLLIGLHAAFYNIDALLATQEDRFDLEEV
ncbi:hypothetical protein ONE63_007657 [Megalurothrips usitatus]|uniref:PRA1 family protein n=1 Tax=Megalurothrips usitatus TaxID=439358 RepID=A0AAV7XSL1_9NEOP|nr:hypothetical protein ONE63_007657 [Megalurothrips usitatus]